MWKTGLAGTSARFSFQTLNNSSFLWLHLHFLVFQSQLARMDKFMNFDRMSRAAPYLSNLTLKLNGKASSSVNCATAWSVPELESRTSGMLIIGYTMSSGSGLSGKMVVCGSCLLDGSSMRFSHSAMVQDKDTIVTSTVMKHMVKVS